MKKLVAVLCLSMACVLAAASPPAEARVLGVYPDQIKDWPINSPAPSFSWGEFLASATGAQFMYPLRLPVGARVTELKAWTRHNNTGTGWVRLIGVKDGTYYEEATGDLARVYLDDGPPGEWYQAVDTTEDGPASARIRPGYRYFLFVYVSGQTVGKVEVVYRAP